MSRIFKDLQRRNVIRAAIGYVVISWTLLQVASLVFPLFDIPQSALRFVLYVLGIGFPFWLLFAYFFEWTSEGLKKTDRTEVVRADMLRSNRRQDRIIIAFLSLAVVLLLADRIINWDGGNADMETRVAVLPFENQTGDPSLEYLADGMSQEICDRLASMQDLVTIARRACLQYKHSDKDPIDIAQALEVGYLIEGNVRKEGDEIRISTQLIDGHAGVQVAAQKYAGTIAMGEILHTMDQAALQIADKLHLTLTDSEVASVKKRYTQNGLAYDAFLKGWMLIESLHADIYPSKEKLDRAKTFFEEAHLLDSTFALAHAGLSMVESFYIFIGANVDYDLEGRSRMWADRALMLEPDLPEGHMAQAELAFVTGQVENAISAYEASLAQKQENPIGWCHLSLACLRAEKYDSAVSAAHTAIVQQPTYVWSHYTLGRALESQHRIEQAIDAYRYVIGLEPSWPNPYQRVGSLQLELKQFDQALDTYQTLQQMNPDRPLVDVAYAYAGLGKKELAFDQLQKVFEKGFQAFDVVEMSPHFAEMRNDERFRSLIKQYQGHK